MTELSAPNRVGSPERAPCHHCGKSVIRIPIAALLFASLVTISTLPVAAGQNLGPIGTFEKWSKVEIDLTGPDSTGLSTSSNPFAVDVDVTFTAPSGGTFRVPAFYDGDGTGGMDGSIWKVRFSPSENGAWTFSSSSSQSLLDNYRGSFTVVSPAPSADDFTKWGRLEYVGKHYLKFADGPYWIKSGADEPEDFLGPGVMGSWSAKRSAIDYLAQKGINSIYIMLHNLGGDGRNVSPWAVFTGKGSGTDSDHFDLDKLDDWDALFDHIQKKGIVLHLVFEDDSAWTGFNRQLYYREMIARFGHYNGLYWNISEEYNETYSASDIRSFAQRIRDLDPYDHPITVHHQGGQSNWQSFLGDNRFDLTSFQTGSSPQNSLIITWRQRSIDAGRPIPISLDESGKIGSSDRTLARNIFWAAYLAGGQFELFSSPMSSFSEFDKIWDDMRRARQFLEALPFWRMEPANQLLSGGSGNRYCLAEAGEAYAVYLESGGSISLDLSGEAGTFRVSWFDPKTGSYTNAGLVSAGELVNLGAAPFSGDAAVVVESDDSTSYFFLTVSLVGQGTVTSSPSGIDCGLVCQTDFQESTPVQLTAVADPGSQFVGWSGDGDCADGSVLMNSAKTCIATFQDQSGNQAPIAQNQQISTVESAPVTFTLAYQDSDGPGPYNHTILSWPANGDLTGSAPNYTYSPYSGFVGSDTLSWIVNDGQADSNVATVTFDIQLNQPPVAQSFAVSTALGTPISISLSPLLDDSDGPGPYSFTIVSSPDNGALTGSDNDWTYTPDAGFTGQDSFSWKASDSLANSNTATVTITVTDNPACPALVQIDDWSTSPKSTYSLATARVGETIYSDRSHQITEMSSEFQNAVLVQSANNDKSVTTGNHLVLTLCEDATISIAYDRRGQSDLPTWLNDGNWFLTNEHLSTTNSVAAPMPIYNRTFSAGTVVLGGNHQGRTTSTVSHYVVIVTSGSRIFTSGFESGDLSGWVISQEP